MTNTRSISYNIVDASKHISGRRAGGQQARPETRIEAALFSISDKLNTMQNQIDEIGKRMNLDNCTGETQTPLTERGVTAMAKHRMRVCVGYNDDGSQIIKYVSANSEWELGDNAARAILASERWSEFVKEGINEKPRANNQEEIVLHETDFDAYAWAYYRRYKEQMLAPNSKTREESALRILCHHLSGKTVESITTDDVQDFMNTRAANKISATTIKDQRKVLAKVLDSAIEDGLIQTNPARSKRLTNPGCDTEGTQPLTLEEAKHLVNSVKAIDDPYRQLLLALYCWTGMRREEVLGLKWEDVDFDAKMIHVQRALTYPKGKPILKQPKSKAGNRLIPMPNPLIDCMKKHRKESGYVILDSATGGWLTENAYSDMFEALRTETSMPKMNALVLRATFATMMAATDIEVKTLQSIMGHAKFTTTMDVYAKQEKTQLNCHRNSLEELLMDDQNKVA